MEVRELRLACYGWVAEGAGSVASAGYVVLKGLLQRGARVDLFAHRDHVRRPEGLEDAGFRYFGYRQPGWLDVLDRAPAAVPMAARRVLLPVVARSWRRRFQPVVEAKHEREPYDAVLTLGTTPAFALRGVPSITWLQSPFGTELDAIRRLRTEISAVSGRTFYAVLTAYYRYAGLMNRLSLIPSEHLILPSEWSRRALISEGADPDRVHAVPYPIDLAAFRPAGTSSVDWERPVLLCLGRLDPRKRLDLLLDSFPVVKEAIPGARLRIVGRPGYSPRQLSLLDRSSDPGGIEYSPEVPRTLVPTLLQEAAVLVQPSENENFGSAVAEALACGTPVVVGPSNGTAAYIDENSAVFSGYDPGAVARSILEVLHKRRDSPAAVSTTTRGAAERWFAPETVADEVLQIIDGAVNPVPPP